MPYADPEKKKARKKAHYEANKEKISAVDRQYILEFLKLQKYLTNQKDLIYKSQT